MSASDPDLVIVGGGLAGLVQACLLDSSGWNVSVLERGDGQQALADPRSIALSESTRRILDSMGIWDTLASQCAPIADIDVSQQGSFGSTHLRAKDERLPALGYVVPAGVLAAALRAASEASPRCTFQTHASVEQVNPGNSRIELTAHVEDSTQTLRPRLLIAADGSRSSLREILGLKAKEVDYNQSAIVAEVQMDRTANGQAYERFTRTGPLALLPHPSGKRALVWAQTRARARQAQAWSDSRFRQAVQQALGQRAGEVLETGPRKFYDLALRRVEKRVGPRSVLIGDAAYSFHPVAAQGFNLIVRDAAWLAQELGQAREKDRDPGDASLLDAYARARDKDAQRVAGFTDLLARGFVMQNPLVRCLRMASLFALERNPQCRIRLVRFGMGADLPQPELALGAYEQNQVRA